MAKLVCTLSLALMLSACAKNPGALDSGSVSCEKFASNYAVQWPGGAIVKSEITACSSGLYTVEADGDAFVTDAPIIQRQSTANTFELVYFENYY